MNEVTEKKTKLMILIPSLECGGSEKFVSHFCNHTCTEKFSITLVVLNNAAPFYTIHSPAIEIIDLKIRRVRSSLFRIIRVIRETKPDILFTASSHLNLYLAIFRGLFPKRIKMFARESSIVSINSNRNRNPRLYKWLVKNFYHRFDCIICQSVYMQHDLVKHFNIPENKTLVINNPVEETAPARVSDKTYAGTSDFNKFITVARLSAEKGIDRLIKAVAPLSLPYQYYIIGEGMEREALQELINTLGLAERIFLCGKKTKPYDGMEDADLMLMGSYYEGFPNVLLEAGILGIPTVAFDAPGGIGEIIVPGENGILVKENDLPAFRSAVEAALKIKFDHNKIIALTKKRFPVNAAVNKLERIFIEKKEMG